MTTILLYSLVGLGLLVISMYAWVLGLTALFLIVKTVWAYFTEAFLENKAVGLIFLFSVGAAITRFYYHVPLTIVNVFVLPTLAVFGAFSLVFCVKVWLKDESRKTDTDRIVDAINRLR